MDIGMKSIGTLFDELSILNIKIWFKLELITNDDSVKIEELAKAARDVQSLNAKRSALVRAINERLGEGQFSSMDKTYE